MTDLRLARCSESVARIEREDTDLVQVVFTRGVIAALHIGCVVLVQKEVDARTEARHERVFVCVATAIPIDFDLSGAKAEETVGLELGQIVRRINGSQRACINEYIIENPPSWCDSRVIQAYRAGVAKERDRSSRPFPRGRRAELHPAPSKCSRSSFRSFVDCLGDVGDAHLA